MGKTATAVNLAAAIAMRGRKTLLIDLARQANGSISFLDHGAIDRGMFDGIADPASELAQSSSRPRRFRTGSSAPADRPRQSRVEIGGELDASDQDKITELGRD